MPICEAPLPGRRPFQDAHFPGPAAIAKESESSCVFRLLRMDLTFNAPTSESKIYRRCTIGYHCWQDERT
jgi:hypothetical protein